MNRTLPAALQAAYAATRYEVRGAAPATLRIGDPPGRHDPWLARLGCREAVIVTAWNPCSVPADASVNGARQRELVHAVEAAGYRWLPACGRDPAGAWPAEESLCVLDAPAAAVDGWLVAYAQNAVVRVARGASCSLVWHPRLRPA